MSHSSKRHRIADTRSMAQTRQEREKRYGRSQDRQAAVILRMSYEERDALAAAAAARGTTVTDLMLSTARKVAKV